MPLVPLWSVIFALLALPPRPLHVGRAPPDVEAPALDSLLIERLVGLGQLYGVVRYFHPGVVMAPAAWDSAMAVTVSRVMRGRSEGEYDRALDVLLAWLKDPSTYLLRPRGDPPTPAEAPRLRAQWRWDSVLVISVAGSRARPDAPEALPTVEHRLARARAVVLDLRTPGERWSPETVTRVLAETGVLARLASQTITAPRQRAWKFDGFPPERGSSSGGYSAGWYDLAAVAFKAAPGTNDKRVVFLVDSAGDIPPIALALQAEGRGAILAAGNVTGDQLVRTHRVALPGGLTAVVRTSEIVFRDSSTGFAPDTVLSLEGDGSGPEQALRLAHRWLRERLGRGVIRPPPGARPEPHRGAARTAEDDGQVAPLLGSRVLAAYRIWSTIHYFYPYKYLMGEDWEGVLRDAIPVFAAANDAITYSLAVARMCTRIHDSHVFVDSPALQRYFGRAAPPVQLRIVQGAPVVAAWLGDSSDTAARRIEIGDVVIAVDGEPVADRMARYGQYLSSSTPQARNRFLALLLLNGPDGSVATLTVRGRAGAVRRVSLPRSPANAWGGGRKARRGAVVRVLPGNIGYVDLDRLAPDRVNQMFEQMRDTRAIIFDMRGYPMGTAWAIAPRLTAKQSVPAADFHLLVVQGPEAAATEIRQDTQLLPRTDGRRYLGRTVMLIDERTASQAEHTGLFFEAANGTQFIGSPSAGTNGDVTNFAIPGGIYITFTGDDVRHADGRQLQRLGLVPDVLVRPTIAGLRAGRDEVLERALEVLGAGPHTGSAP